MRLLVLLLAAVGLAAAEQSLLNASYDPTRELYKEINAAFAAARPGTTVKTSHGGSGKQARAVIDGLDADVATLAIASDIDAIAAAGRTAADWRGRLPHGSSPYTSVIVFLVRKGNPKAIADWPDLVKPGVVPVAPNPKTSGGARLAWLAAWGSVTTRGGGTDAAVAYTRDLFRRIPVLDSGARAATGTFVQRRIGDVLLTWENEALLARQEMGRDAFDIVYPPVTVLAEPPVAVVDAVAGKRGTTALATDYLQFLYTPAAQAIIAKHGFRPRDAAAGGGFPVVATFTVEQVAGSWADATRLHFADGGFFDQAVKR